MTVEPGGQIEAVGASHDRELGIDACTMALALDRLPDRLLASLCRACRKPDPEVSRMGRALVVGEDGRVNDNKFPVDRWPDFVFECRPPAGRGGLSWRGASCLADEFGQRDGGD